VVKRNLMISWRDWLTEHVFSRWMRAGRHYLISHLPGEHDNPDGRIAEDCRVATESAVSLAHSLFTACSCWSASPGCCGPIPGW
jgi:putative ATP-binding cassette transporter